MFVVILSYTAPLAEIDAQVPAHAAWLDQQYADGVFVASGRQVPRVGGVILAVGVDKDELDHRLARDPFAQHGLATYTVTQFEATKVGQGLERLTG